MQVGTFFYKVDINDTLYYINISIDIIYKMVDLVYSLSTVNEGREWWVNGGGKESEWHGEEHQEDDADITSSSGGTLVDVFKKIEEEVEFNHEKDKSKNKSNNSGIHAFFILGAFDIFKFLESIRKFFNAVLKSEKWGQHFIYIMIFFIKNLLKIISQ